MIKFSPLVRKQSALADYPEVTFTIRRISHGIRSRIRLDLSKVLATIRDKSDEINDMIDQGGFASNAPASLPTDEITTLPDDTGTIAVSEAPSVGAPGTPDFTNEQRRLIEKISSVNNDIEIITGNDVDPVYLEHGFVSMTGIDVTDEDGNPTKRPVTWQWLFKEGPEDLCREVLEAIKAQAGIGQTVKENLSSPSTSGAPVAGQTSDTNVPSVDPTVGTEGATVVSITQN